MFSRSREGQAEVPRERLALYEKGQISRSKLAVPHRTEAGCPIRRCPLQPGPSATLTPGLERRLCGTPAGNPTRSGPGRCTAQPRRPVRQDQGIRQSRRGGQFCHRPRSEIGLLFGFGVFLGPDVQASEAEANFVIARDPNNAAAYEILSISLMLQQQKGESPRGAAEIDGVIAPQLFRIRESRAGEHEYEPRGGSRTGFSKGD